MVRRFGFRKTAAAGVAVAIGVLAIPATGLSLVFSSPLTYTVGTNPEAIAAADFNGDAKADLAVANAGSGDVSILLGNGDGTFQAATSFVGAPGAASITAGDLNGDTFPDLVLPNSGLSRAVVLLGNGDGTFQTGVPYPAGPNPTSVALGDFNNDGITDIATNGSPGRIAVLRGNGDGTFQSPVGSHPLDSAGMLAAGDMNGDGFADLAVLEPSTASGVILLGNGLGGFQPPARFPTGPPTAVAVADVNGDGISDAAFVSTAPLLSILLGSTSAGPLLLAQSGEPSQSVTTGDFDGDGTVDLFFGQSVGAVLFKPGHGDGTFGGGFKKFVAPNPVAFATGDFNGDGKLDLAAAGDGTDVVSILLNDAVAVQQNVSAGGTVSTGTEATSDTPVQVDATAPAPGGTITITSSNTATGSGFAIAGQEVNITTFTSAADPFQFTFRIDASQIPTAQSATTLDVYKDGSLVADCAGQGATPDPCVISRVQLASGDAQVTVLTSTASTWTFSFRVYAFNGFFQPVDNAPVLNEVQAGRGVPVRFSLGGFQGFGIFATGYPKSQQISCSSNAPVDAVEQTVSAGASSLSYDSSADMYTYVWKTDRSWSGTCRQFVMRLAGGEYRRAIFKFR